MKVGSGQMIRNGSGQYGCPVSTCWRRKQTGINHGTKNCPNCGVELEWE